MPQHPQRVKLNFSQRGAFGISALPRRLKSAVPGEKPARRDEKILHSEDSPARRESLTLAPVMNGSSGYFPHEPRVARDLLVRRLHVSSREAEVLWWVMHEKSNDEIGAELGVSSLTVKTHVQNLCKRLDCHSKVGLAVCGTAILSREVAGPLPPEAGEEGRAGGKS